MSGAADSGTGRQKVNQPYHGSRRVGAHRPRFSGATQPM